MSEARGAQAKIKPAASMGDTLQADNVANSVGCDLTTLSRSAAHRGNPKDEPANERQGPERPGVKSSHDTRQILRYALGLCVCRDANRK